MLRSSANFLAGIRKPPETLLMSLKKSLQEL